MVKILGTVAGAIGVVEPSSQADNTVAGLRSAQSEAGGVPETVIRGEGCLLGQVYSVGRDTARDDRQSVLIAWNNASSHFDTEGDGKSRWTFQASAKSIQIGDV